MIMPHDVAHILLGYSLANRSQFSPNSIEKLIIVAWVWHFQDFHNIFCGSTGWISGIYEKRFWRSSIVLLFYQSIAFRFFDLISWECCNLWHEWCENNDIMFVVEVSFINMYIGMWIVRWQRLELFMLFAVIVMVHTDQGVCAERTYRHPNIDRYAKLRSWSWETLIFLIFNSRSLLFVSFRLKRVC